jgi:hypothetical protein
MTPNHTTLIYNLTGQTLEFYPPDAEVVGSGAPTVAATVTAWEPSTGNAGTAEWGPSAATLDSVSTTVDASSGYSQSNRSRLYLTATTNVAVGRRYLVTNAYGQREVVRVKAIASADYVDLEAPLAYDYAAADTFVGLRHTIAAPDAFLTDSSKVNTNTLPSVFGDDGGGQESPPYRVKWAYSTGSISQQAWTTFDLSHRRASADLSIEDLREVLPDVAHVEWLSQRGQNFAPQLRAAEKALKINTRIAGYDPDAILDPMIWGQLLLQQWAIHIGEAVAFGTADPEQPWVSGLREKHRALFNASISIACKVWIDTTGTGAITSTQPSQLWLASR